jgi:glucose/arabinose dehydrogenase
MKTICSILILLASFAASGQTKLAPQKVRLSDGRSFSLNLPTGYEIVPAAEGLRRVRFFAKAPDGRIFVTDMHDLTDNEKGAVYILDAFDPETGKFGKVIPYLTKLRNPNSVQFYTDPNGQDWIYLAETDKLTRRRFTRGETSPTDPRPETIATFPDYGLSYKYGGWHLTRTIAFSPNGKLYISVGSSCNACEEKEKIRATVLEMNPNGSGRRIFAKGLRNAVGLKWRDNNLYATNQGSDHLGLNKPDETFYALRERADYGWPSCFQSNGRVFADKTAPDDLKLQTRPRSCRGVPISFAYFPAHSSALGFEHFGNDFAGSELRNAFAVALHGSTNKDLAKGYRIVIARRGRKPQDFVTGFLNGTTVNGRPCDIFRVDNNSFLFTDDHKGIVYLIRKTRD